MKSFAFPGNIEPEILAIAAGQVPYMRTEWFSKMTLESEAILLGLLDCSNGRVIPYTASGTAAMDACVSSFVSSRKMPLVINGGTFGARWGNICHYYGLHHEEFPVPFGKNPDLELLADRLKSGKYDVLLMQHHETSSGCLFDLQTISQLCRANNVRLVVDAIGSFLADPFSMDASGIDVAILSSHKGLNLPPGLSFAVLSKTVAEAGNFGSKGFYYDWDEHLRNLSRGQTPFSPATHLFMQLHARLKKIQNDGVPKTIEQVKLKADVFRQNCVERGWTFSADTKSNCLTGVYLPFPVRPLINYLGKHEVYVMPSGPENMIRVTHLGTLDCHEQTMLANEIETWQKNAKQ